MANGETLKVKGGGKITGAVTINSANLIVEDGGVVEGDISVTNQGNVVVRKSGKINGAVNINHASTMKVVNKGVIKGNVIINNANRLQIAEAVQDFFAATRLICAHPKVRSFDLTEFDSSLDVAAISALTAARWTCEALAGFLRR